MQNAWRLRFVVRCQSAALCVLVHDVSYGPHEAGEAIFYECTCMRPMFKIVQRGWDVHQGVIVCIRILMHSCE